MASVLVVDDMALYRSVLSRTIDGTDGLEVVGKAVDGHDCLDQLRQLKPDLVTLDLEMPGMTGLEVLEQLKKQPIPGYTPRIIVFSAQSKEGAEVTLKALGLGAVDFVLKPTASQGVAAIEKDLVPRLLSFASQVNSAVRRRPLAAALAESHSSTMSNSRKLVRRKLLIIASSTGGPPALEKALSALPATFPSPVLVVQHMPPLFTATMAQNLNRMCALSVKEAEDGDLLEAGKVFIAPGDYHMVVNEDEGQLRIGLDQGERIYGLRPAADVTLRSLEQQKLIEPNRMVLSVFTGMGQDGLEGCRGLKKRGMTSYTQSKESCVVYGMPKALDDENIADGHFTPETFFETIKELPWHW